MYFTVALFIYLFFFYISIIKGVMTSLNDSTGMLLDSSPTTYNTKSAYEAGLVVDAPSMNKTDVNGFIQDRTFKTMFPPVCIKTHWDSETFSKHVLPADLKIPLPVDPRPLVRNCTVYYSTAPKEVSGDKEKRGSLGLLDSVGGLKAPFEVFAKNINSESEILLNHPQDRCDDNKWSAALDSDLYTNRAAPPKVEGSAFFELSRPLATIIPGPYKCRASADELAWSKSPRLFNNVTREDRLPGGDVRSSEALLAKGGAFSGKVDVTPRVWPSASVVFYVGAGDGGIVLLRLCQAFVARGYEVTVFSDSVTSKTEGISFHRHDEFVTNDIYSTIIMWGVSKLISNYQHRPSAKVLLLHIDEDVDVCVRTIKESVNKIVVKSVFHRSLYNCYPWSKFEIIPNGLPVELFIKNKGILRERYRVLVTEASQSLVTFVKNAWLRILSANPKAEMHVFYRPDEKSFLPYIQNSPGVIVHSVGALEELIVERFKSSVHLTLEQKDVVSNDSLRLSALAGCIPIMPARGVNTELGGVNVDVGSDLIEYAKAINAVFKDDVYSRGLRVRLQKDNSLKGWNATCDRWITIINGIKKQE